MATATTEVVDSELEAHAAVTRFKAELEEWLDSRVRATGDRVTGYKTTVKLSGGGSNCGLLALVYVSSEDDPTILLSIDTPCS